MIEKDADVDLVREMLAFAADRLMEMEVEAATNDLFIVRAFAIAATTDFDWNGDGSIDAADLDAGTDTRRSRCSA